MPPPLLHLDSIQLTFGGHPLLDGAGISVGAGERIALVGRNGSGKSTLLKIAAGMVEAQAGEVFRQPGATIRYLPQMPDMDGFDSVTAYVEAGLGPSDDPHRATYLLDQLDVAGGANPAHLSGGEARRAALARVLAPKPDVLLLDEPTNHLDLAAIEWLEGEISRMSAAAVVISHDRRFLQTVSNATIWLDRGTTRRIERGFGHFEEWRDTILEEEQQELHKLGRKIVREEHWLRYGVTARRKRNQKRLKDLGGLRERLRTHRHAEGRANLKASDAPDSGKLAIEAEGIGKSFDGRSIVQGFSIRIRRGDKIGFVGPNGAGKTTLVRMLTGRLAPDTGTVRLGVNLEMVWLDQTRDLPDPDESLSHYLTGGRGDALSVNGQERHVVSYMKDFLFLPEQARTPVRELSGGERARLILARLLARPSNLLVLDEPTNDLDLETLDLMQELITGFEGTVLLVSHDRDFLDRTVTRTIAPEEEGAWTIYAGGYSDLLSQRGTGSTTGRKRAGKARQPSSERRDTRQAGASRKLSYKQKFALETLPGKIEAVTAEIKALESQIADPSLYSRDADAFARMAAEIEQKRSALSGMEEQWLELEMLRESMAAE